MLDIPGGLFGQDDVRETATSDSSVTGTLFWSCVGANFHALNPDTDTVHLTSNVGNMRSDATGIIFQASINLPHNATITGAVVEGNPTNETWQLRRMNISSGAGDGLATGNFDTEDTSIINAKVNNETHAYFFETSSLDNVDTINGARITYTI